MKEKGWGYTRKTQRKEKEKGCEVAHISVFVLI